MAVINPWWGDPRIGQAERMLTQGSGAARRRDHAAARAHYAQAGELYAEVAALVPRDRPDTHRDLVEAAISCARYMSGVPPTETTGTSICIARIAATASASHWLVTPICARGG